MKKRIVPVIFALFCIASTLFSGEEPLLVLDGQPLDEFPKNFRYTEGSYPKMIGSGAFAQDQFERILNLFPDEKIVVIDLRMESHAFLNGDPISWYSLLNWANLGKSPAAIQQDETCRINLLRQQLDVILYQIVEKSDAGEVTEVYPIWTPIYHVQSEQELVESYGIEYHRFYVPDHCPPSLYELQRFLELLKTLPPDARIYFHCRGGRGRTTSFMVMLDVLYNWRRFSFEQLLDRQVATGGKDMRVLCDEGKAKYPFAVARLEFLRQFYESVSQGAIGPD